MQNWIEENPIMILNFSLTLKRRVPFSLTKVIQHITSCAQQHMPHEQIEYDMCTHLSCQIWQTFLQVNFNLGPEGKEKPKS